MKISKLILFMFLFLVAYLAFWPVPVDPVAWQAPKAPELVGKYQQNEKLSEYETFSLDGLHGPEAVIGDGKGNLYTATHEGWIIRWFKDLQGNVSPIPEKWVEAGGRPLGIDFDAQGNLWVANAYVGLQKITPQGDISVQANTAEGIEIVYADDVVVAPNGKIYFSDASTKFGAKAAEGTLSGSLLDLMEHSLNGRIIEFDPTSKSSTVVMRDLSFANGVAVDDAGDFLLVAETGGYRVWKLHLQGDKAGKKEVLLENLPGFPDNVHRGQNGRFWVGLTSPRSQILDDLADKPAWRKVVQRLPAFMRPAVQSYGHVIAFDADGNILASLQNPHGTYEATTGAWEENNYLYISSLTEDKLARVHKAKLGL